MADDPAAVLASEKRKIRREALARRDALTEKAQQRASCLITERLLGHQCFYLAKSLLCYINYGSELDTGELIREALRLGKRVYAPRVAENRRMDFFQIHAPEELQPGFHGILEPPETSRIYDMRETERTLMLMPGVAFDPYGNRLGYGGGYYDRYLAAHPQLGASVCAYTIAIGHSCQLVESLPVEDTDCRPCQVLLV